MGLDNTLITKGAENLLDWIDEIDFALIKGLLYIALFIISLWFVLYFLGYQAFNGHWLRTIVILAIWLVSEFAYWLGRGHDNH